MLELTRIYKNSAEDVLQTDSIIMESIVSSRARDPSNITYRRNLSTQIVLESADRVVDTIAIVYTVDPGYTVTYDYDPSGSNNYSWLKWTNNKTAAEIICNMSDRPNVGDTV